MSETLETTDERVQAAGQVRVLLVDDHDLFRTGLRNLVQVAEHRLLEPDLLEHRLHDQVGVGKILVGQRRL